MSTFFALFSLTLIFFAERKRKLRRIQSLIGTLSHFWMFFLCAKSRFIHCIIVDNFNVKYLSFHHSLAANVQCFLSWWFQFNGIPQFICLVFGCSFFGCFYVLNPNYLTTRNRWTLHSDCKIFLSFAQGFAEIQEKIHKQLKHRRKRLLKKKNKTSARSETKTHF